MTLRTINITTKILDCQSDQSNINGQVSCYLCGSIIALSNDRKDYLKAINFNTRKYKKAGVLWSHVYAYEHHKTTREAKLMEALDHPSFCQGCLNILQIDYMFIECGCGG